MKQAYSFNLERKNWISIRKQNSDIRDITICLSVYLAEVSAWVYLAPLGCSRNRSTTNLIHERVERSAFLSEDKKLVKLLHNLRFVERES